MTDHAIIYAYDALCGWCYGFGPVVEQLHARWHHAFPFEVMSGGMVRGAQVRPIRHMAGYIRQSAPQLARTTGVTLGKKFLDGLLTQGNYVSNSEPPARALVAFRRYRPDQQLAFARALQQAFYGEGKDLNHDATYRALATGFGLDADKFMADLHAPATAREARAEFDRLATLGVNGFPTLLLREGGRHHELTRGYQSLPALEALLQAVAAGS